MPSKFRRVKSYAYCYDIPLKSNVVRCHKTISKQGQSIILIILLNNESDQFWTPYTFDTRTMQVQIHVFEFHTHLILSC